ncbi:MAG: hypothetical protein A2552_03900 [Sulfuricurvum sp. RIFOXYD2_FULL_44_160]|uniref:Uncharacterized protein n=1 Tax=Sulfuricurvum kujiense TaxID=148813 RepID=A0A2D3WMK4_9BACT|nr:MAG: hypothetical protein A2517_05345 [Sulfuricurvum sp. RIFOXYD12_FULL_44_77]OHD99970.1 MAG: hypothetical protein A2552_03900 [Sulfuricurvum sp. RIFOXYD2_FULL_44_160]DAB38359.1 MAG TPA: hypothetical protein CFH83_06320 [Sulfuricurvum kujiense]
MIFYRGAFALPNAITFLHTETLNSLKIVLFLTSALFCNILATLKYYDLFDRYIALLKEV